MSLPSLTTVLLAPSLSNAGSVPYEVASSNFPRAAAELSCPSPTAEELDIATSRVRWLIEQPVRAGWRSELGLAGATQTEAVALVSSAHMADCAALYAVAPFDGGGLTTPTFTSGYVTCTSSSLPTGISARGSSLRLGVGSRMRP